MVLNTKHSKSGNIEEEIFANYTDPLEDPWAYWEMLLGKCVALGGNKVRLHYSRMKKKKKKKAVPKACSHQVGDVYT